MKQKPIAAFGVAVSLVLVLSTYAEANPALLDRSLSLASLSQELTSPSAIARYIWKNFSFEEDRRQFGREDYWQSPEEMLATRKGDCEDFALFASEILKKQGVTSFVVSIYGGKASHTICIFKKDGVYGAIDGANVVESSTDLRKVITSVDPFWKRAAIVTPSTAKKGRILSQINKEFKARRNLGRAS